MMPLPPKMFLTTVAKRFVWSRKPNLCDFECKSMEHKVIFDPLGFLV